MLVRARCFHPTPPKNIMLKVTGEYLICNNLLWNFFFQKHTWWLNQIKQKFSVCDSRMLFILSALQVHYLLWKEEVCSVKLESKVTRKGSANHKAESLAVRPLLNCDWGTSQGICLMCAAPLAPGILVYNPHHWIRPTGGKQQEHHGSAMQT